MPYFLSWKILYEGFGNYCNKYWQVSITDNCNNAVSVVDIIKEKLKEDYVDHEGKMIETNKGI